MIDYLKIIYSIYYEYMCLCTRSKTKICSKNECRDNSDINMYMVIIIDVLQRNCPLVPFT